MFLQAGVDTKGFNEISLMAFDNQLDNYVVNMRSGNDFSDLLI